MAMQQCPNGHLFDDSKNSSCPYCSGANANANAIPLGGVAFPSTTPLDNFAPAQGYVVPQPEVARSEAFPATTPVGPEFSKTTYVSGMVNEKGIVEVRGWLVCLEGEKRGVDFKIRGEKSTIGRGENNDIKIDFDSAVSKGVNATIAYDTRNNKFFIYGGEATKNNIYVNDQLLMTPIELKDYDVIDIGQTKLLFRSLCNDQFNWSNVKKDAE